jgi:hypothetical protein
VTRTRRAWILRAILRCIFRDYNEKCWRCGWPVAWGAGTWWHAPDWLWARVVGSPLGGVLCMRCFARKALGVGIVVSWVAQSNEPSTTGASDG